jgi:hypothetical protein
MTLASTSVGNHLSRRERTARALFVDVRGEAETLVREAEVAALPVVNWKGKPLVTIRCHGTRGKGPHDVNVPRALVWSLIDWRSYVCPYHR